MGSATIVALAIIAVVVLIFWGVLSPIVFGLLDHATGLYTATQLQPRVGQDEIICDLRVKTLAFLETSSILGKELGIDDNDNPFPAKIFVTIDPKNPYDADFFECHNFSQFPAASLIDIEERWNGGLSQMDFFSIGGEKIHGEIVIRDKSDPTQKVDAFTQPALRQAIELPAGIVDTPLDISIEYVVTNIPLREYTLEIYYGREINNLDAGEPFITQICKNGGKVC